MGIHSLNEFVRARAPRTFRSIETSAFAQTRIAIDAPLWSYSSFSAVYANHIQNKLTEGELLSETPFSEAAKSKVREAVFHRARQFSGDLLARGITPVFVFDGTSVPEKTSGARTRRLATKARTESRISETRKCLNELPPANRSPSDVLALRNLLKQSPPVNPREDLPALREFLIGLGIPCLEAPDEAEKYCAFLAAKGLASASWTTDTDSYAFGAPIFITGYDPTLRPTDDRAEFNSDTYYRATHFSATLPPIAMRTLGMTRAQFTDLCIMLECDFNSRMEGVGPVKIAKLLTRALDQAPTASRLIEVAAVDSPDLPWHVLNAERCRGIFLDDTQCVAAFSSLGGSSLDLNRELAEAEFGAQFARWLSICGDDGAINVKIR